MSAVIVVDTNSVHEIGSGPVHLGRHEEAAAWLQKDLHKGRPTKFATERLAKLRQATPGAPPPAAEKDDEAECVGDTSRWAERRAAPDKRTSTFHKERHLELELVATLERDQRVFDRRLRLYAAPDGTSGQQFAMPGFGIIDLLTNDLDTGDLVVIELKRDAAGEEVLQQVLRYIDGVRKTVALPKQDVRGVVVVREASEALRCAAAAAGVEVRTYEVHYKLSRPELLNFAHGTSDVSPVDEHLLHSLGGVHGEEATATDTTVCTSPTMRR